eukprot:GEMP01037254.1.p1 GENE.GEMP01037254.1~~GEMP01037254.1.p1  ORF type:complete len:259 (+),score=66.83 GEMP01037254.1:30-806(+)
MAVELEVQLKNVVEFRKLVDAMEQFTQQATVMCTQEDGMQLNCVDSSSVALAKWHWGPSAFESFQCKGTVTIGLNFNVLFNVLRAATPHEPVTLRKMVGKDVLKVIFGNDENSFLSVKLLDIEWDPVEVNDEEGAQTTMKIKTETFQRVMKNFGNFSETINVDIAKRGCTFTVHSDLGQAGQYYKHEDELSDRSVQISLVANIQEDYNIRYLQTFAKSCPLTDVAVIKVMPGAVMSVMFPMEDVKAGSITFFLGPRLQ